MAQAALVFNLVVCFGVPLAALAAFFVRSRSHAALFGLGVAGFVVSQMLVRMPLLSLVQQSASYIAFAAVHPYVCAFLIALSAAVVEEAARFVILRFQRRREFDASAAVAYGFGHGGVEAALVGMSSAALLFSSSWAGLDGSAALAGLERIGAMALQIALSIMVYLAVMRRSAAPLACALVVHTAVDFATVLPAAAGIPLAAFEAVFLACALGVLGAALRAAKKGPCIERSEARP